MTVRRLLAVFLLMSTVAARPAAQQSTYKIGDPGVTAPRPMRQVHPWYTADAMRAGVQGVVIVQCVVLPNGTPNDCRALRTLHPDLDQAALGAASQWLFVPGMKDGVAVPVLIEIEMSFTLRNNRTRLGFDAAGVFKQGDEGLVMPQLIDGPKPKYPPDTMREGISGLVLLDCIVDRDGSVVDVRVASPLDPRLDGAAVGTLRTWRFKPGMKDNAAVPVQIQVEMTFHVK
jgi:TonB family protein